MTSLMTVRRAVTLSFLIAWIFVGVSGYLLLTSALLIKAGITLPLRIITDVHVYSGFTALGISALHIALNYDALKSYVRSVLKGSGRERRIKTQA